MKRALKGADEGSGQGTYAEQIDDGGDLLPGGRDAEVAVDKPRRKGSHCQGQDQDEGKMEQHTVGKHLPHALHIALSEAEGELPLGCDDHSVGYESQKPHYAEHEAVEAIVLLTEGFKDEAHGVERQ